MDRHQNGKLLASGTPSARLIPRVQSIKNINIFIIYFEFPATNGIRDRNFGTFVKFGSFTYLILILLLLEVLEHILIIVFQLFRNYLFSVKY